MWELEGTATVITFQKKARTTEHARLVRSVHEALKAVPRRAYDATQNLILHGLWVSGAGDSVTDEGQATHGDVIPFTAG